jgi:hypothetical protein
MLRTAERISINPLAQATEWQSRGPANPYSLAILQQAVLGIHWCHQGTIDSLGW